MGIAVRLLYLVEHAASPLFAIPILDERFYHDAALALTDGGRGLATLNPGFRPLLYPLYLAAFYAISIDWGPLLAVAGQHLLGVATTLVIASLTLDLCRPGSGHRAAVPLVAAAAAAGLYLLAGPPLFFEGELLTTSLFTFQVSVLLWLLFRCSSTALAATAGCWLAAGCWLGIMAQARPNALIIAVALPLFAVTAGAGSRRRLLGRSALTAGALVATLAFAALVQMPWTHRWQLLPGSGGVNLYLGNKQGADGMVPEQDRHAAYGDRYQDSVSLFAEREYRRQTQTTGPIDTNEASRYWLRRTGDEIRQQPMAWLELMGHKTMFLLWQREIANNRSYDFARLEESSILRRLPVRWWWLLVLAGIGLVGAWHRIDRDRARWLLLVLATYGAGVVLFFVNSRYRLPMWPAMAVLAGVGVAWLWTASADVLARSNPSSPSSSLLPTVLALATGGVLATISLINWFDVPAPTFGRDFYYRSLARLQAGDIDGAAQDAQQAVERLGDAASWTQRGIVAMARERWVKASLSLQRALKLEPSEPRIFTLLGVAYEQLGQHRKAYLAYANGVRTGPHYSPAFTQMGLFELRLQRTRAAADKIAQANALVTANNLQPSAALHTARALLAQLAGDAAGHRRELDAARQLDPKLVERLLELQQQPLELGRS